MNTLPVIIFVAGLCLLFHSTSVNGQTEQKRKVISVKPAAAPAADTSNVPIHIDNMQTMTVIKTDSGEFTWFRFNVVLRQGSDTLYCDSALQNNTTKNFEAFSDVRIAQAGGTHGTSDYLKYTSAKKEALMRGNVQMTDGKNRLTCAELTYDLGPKIAIYDNGGKLYNDSTTVTSRWGEYNIQNKEAKFKGNVVVTDTQYQIRSEDLMYNTETKITNFFARSEVKRDSGRSVLVTSDGWYDGKNGIAHFKGISSIWNDGQYLESDSLLNYDKLTGYGYAYGRVAPADTVHPYGRVISIDTAHHSTMYCGHAEYHKAERTLLATIRAVLVQVNGKDTLYIRADTFYSAPMVKSRKSKVESRKSKAGSLQLAVDSSHLAVGNLPPDATKHIPGDTTIKIPGDAMSRAIADSVMQKAKSDSLAKIKQDAADDALKPVVSSRFHVPTSKEYTTKEVVPQKLKKKKRKKERTMEERSIIKDTTAATADTTAPLYFIGYHHVLIFSDSMQGKCDSVCYTRADSLIRMMYNPIVWSHKSQITGDTILMQLDSGTLRKMYVPNNALLVSQSGPERAHLFDQIQGKTLTAYFKNNTISELIVKPDAESIYYNKDDKGYYLGVSQSTSDRIFTWFEDQKIKKIKFDVDAHITDTPLEKADLPEMKLSKFKWLMDQRPKSKEELFR